MSTRSGDIKDGRMKEIIRELASQYISREGGKASLITVTNIQFDHTENKALIYVSVFPDHKETEAMDFLKRKRTELREFITENSSFGRIPYVDFLLDTGEKNRQRIEEISNMA
ncbi:MAG: ribosome-binding factor A [Candidatus Taylorbacteria bacterium]|nr:ribosome-binding factor A [Candidatus Taylorbacteria bacterium]